MSKEGGAQTPVEKRSEPRLLKGLLGAIGPEDGDDPSKTREGDGEFTNRLECSEILQIEAPPPNGSALTGWQQR